MKKKMNRFMVGLLSAGMICTACGALAACGEAIELPDYTYDYSEPVEDFGDGISIDGKLDESHYTEGRALTAAIRSTTAEYKMYSYYGEKGIYFGFDIKDDAVFYNEAREIWANSGVEFCVGSAENLTTTYEIDLNVGGKRMLRKFLGTSNTVYLNWFSDLHSAVYVDGTINGECRGYSAEIYLPYHLFNADNTDTPVDTVLVNPGIIRASSADATNTDRLWYSIGEQERGIGWAPAQSNWYHFTRGVGLEANDVTLKAGDHGTLTGSNFFIPGDRYTVTVKPDDGYYLEELLFAGRDVTDNLEYFAGTASYTGVAQANEDIEISAKFAPLPSVLHTFSGKVTAEGELKNARLYAIYAGAYREIAIGADGSFSTQLPATEWTVYCSADGLLTAIETIDLSQDLQYDFRLIPDYLQADNPAFWNMEQLSKGSVYGTQGDWLTSALHKTIQGTKAFVSANLVVKHSNDDVRAGFVFEAENGFRMFIVINAQVRDHSYGIQFINGGSGVDSADEWGAWQTSDIGISTEEQIHLLTTTGMPMAALYDGAKVRLWLNGVSVGEHSLKPEMATKYGITETTNVKPGIVICSKDTEFHKLSFNTTGFEDGYPIQITKEGRGNITVENGATTFTPGEQVRFTVTPNDGYACTELTVNGRDCLRDLNSGVFEYTTPENVVVCNVVAVFSAAQSSISGVVKSGDTPLSGIEVRFTRGEESFSEITDASGNFHFETISGGLWTVIVNGEGEHYNELYGTLVREATINDIEMTFEFDLVSLSGITVNELYILDGDRDNYDIEGLPTEDIQFAADGKHVLNSVSGGTITFNYDGEVDANWNREIKTALHAESQDDFWVSANFRKEDSFDMTKAQRYGFVLRNDAWWIGATLIRNAGDGSMQVQLYHDWANDGVTYWRSYTLTAEEKTAWESEDGIGIAIARINNVYHIYMERDGEWIDVYSTKEYDESSTGRAIDLAVQIHTPNKGAILRDFTWIRGDIDFNIQIEKHDHVTVTPEQSTYALGDDVKLIFTPEEGKYPFSVLINGEEKVADLSQEENGDWVLTLENYTAKRGLKVEAEFGDSVVIAEVKFDLTLHRLGVGDNNRSKFANGTAVDLVGLEDYHTTVEEGIATFTMVNAGEYTLQIAGCADQTVTVSQDDTELELTVEYNTIAKHAANFDVDEINDGKLSIRGGDDGAKLVFTETVAQDEDFIYWAVLSNLKRPATAGDRIGFWMGYDRDNNGGGDPWDEGPWGGAREALYTAIRLNADVVDKPHMQIEWTQASQYWETYSFENAQATAFESAEGLRIGFARIAGKYYVVAETADRSAYNLYAFNFTDFHWAFKDVPEVPLQIGFYTGSGRSEKICDLTELEIIRVKNGRPFGDETLDKAFQVTVNSELHGATLTTDPTPVRFGDITLTFAPENGGIPTQFLVNGDNKLTDLVERDGEGNWIYHVRGYFQNELNIEATFSPDDGQPVDVSFNVTLHKLGLGSNNTAKVTEEDNVVLKQGDASYTPESVVDGVVSFKGLKKGAYTLEADGGYLPATVDCVYAFENRPVALEYDLVKSYEGNYSFTPSGINDGRMTIGGDEGATTRFVFNGTVGTDEDFYYSAVISNLDITNGDGGRMGFYVGGDFDGNGTVDGGNIWTSRVNTEMLYTALRLSGTTNAVKIEWTQAPILWEQYAFTDVQLRAMKDASGLSLGFARIAGKYYVIAATDSNSSDYVAFPYNQAAGTPFETIKGPVEFGFFTSSQRTNHAKICDLSHLAIHVAKTGSDEAKELFKINIQSTLGEGVTLTTDPEKPVIGETFTLKLSRASGVPVKFEVNGQDKLSDLKPGQDGYTYTVPTYLESKLTVEAEYSDKELATVNLTLLVKLHRFGVGDNNLSLFASGTEVSLEGLFTYKGNTAADGRVGFTEIKEGTYLLKIAGCLDKEITVTADATQEQEVNVEFNLVLAQGDRFDTSKINDGEATYHCTETSGESHMKLAIESGTGDFFFAVTLKKDIAHLNVDKEGFRYGITLFANGAGNDIHITLYSPWGDMAGKEFCLAANNWADVNQSSNLTDAEATAWEQGIEIAVARKDGKFYGLIKSGDAYAVKYSFESAGYANQNMNMGLAGWRELVDGATFRNMTFSTSIPADVNSAITAE